MPGARAAIPAERTSARIRELPKPSYTEVVHQEQNNHQSFSRTHNSAADQRAYAAVQQDDDDDEEEEDEEDDGVTFRPSPGLPYSSTHKRKITELVCTSYVSFSNLSSPAKANMLIIS